MTEEILTTLTLLLKGIRMMSPSGRGRVALLLLMLVAVLASSQGMYWEMTTTMDGKDGKQTQFSYMPKKYRVAPEGEMISIIRLDQEKLLLVDGKRKTYHEMAFSEMEEMLKGVDVQMQEAQKQLDQLPPDQRKMVEEMMGKMHGKKEKKAIEVVKGGETKTINGFRCTNFILKRDGKNEATVWATNDIGIPASAWKEMWKDMEEFSKRIAAMMPGGEGELVEKSHSLVDGFPICTELNDKTTMTVTKVEKRSIPAAAFEVPADFTRENPPIMEGKPE
jgi:hypothetical protein